MPAYSQRQSFLFDRYGGHVTAQPARSYRPDAITVAVIAVFSNSLLMFGYQNALENGDLEVPAAPAQFPKLVEAHAIVALCCGGGT